MDHPLGPEFRLIYNQLVNELQGALLKYPTFNSAHEGYAVILEEMDELWDVVKLKQATPGRETQLFKEALQVAAMAIRFMLDMPAFKN